MNESMVTLDRRNIFAGLFISGSLVLGALSAMPAQAANDPCPALNKVMMDRVQLIQHIQGYKDKKPTAEEACSSFSKLAKANTDSVTALERDGAWCRAPEGSANNLKAQQAQIEAAKTNACKAAEEQKKAAANGGAGQRQPLGGTGDILGGPMKLPQGAL